MPDCNIICTCEASELARPSVWYSKSDCCATGGVIASKKEILGYPTRTNQIPRHIPPPHWASNPLVLFFAAGLLPFGTIFVELYFAMTSIWQVRSSFKVQMYPESIITT